MTQSLEALAQEIGKKFKKSGQVLTVAESCTGGGLGFWVTSVSGSSAWFERGFITYSNSSKIELLGVNPDTIQTHGAVSSETAREMADGALKNSKATISLSITGIAGPSGGSDEKQVGTVWIGLARLNQTTQTKRYQFSGSRQDIRKKAIENALGMLLTIHDE